MLKYSPGMNRDDQIAALRRGDRRALAQAITLIESTRADHRTAAEQLLSALISPQAATIRIGITGTPGVGKSTFIESFGSYLTLNGHRVAVLAVDPSSNLRGGAILGDKTRMERLARDPNAFIRPSPSGGTLGGVARRTREAILLVEAAGFDVVLVETVGVGQSETAVADMTDLFLLMLAPGGGDELQGIKRGIMELADIVVVNKADGPFAAPAKLAAADYSAALRLLTPRVPAWQPPVLLTSALTGAGMKDVWVTIGRYRETVTNDGTLKSRRATQAVSWMWNEISETLLQNFKTDPAIKQALSSLESRVLQGEITPAAAAAHLLAQFSESRIRLDDAGPAL